MKQIKINYEFEVILCLLKREMHGRELVKELKTSLTRIQRILRKLRDYNILDYKKEGKNHIYFIKKNLVSRVWIMNAENYKLAKVVSKYSFLEPLFQDIIEEINSEPIILFGSYAKDNPKKNSDIDIYVNTTSLKISKKVEEMNDLINVKIGKFDKDEILIKEIIKNHVIIKGVEKYYEEVEFFK